MTKWEEMLMEETVRRYGPRFLCNGFSYYGMPKQLVGGVWVHEERQPDGTVRLIPLVPVSSEP